jgi:ribose transport system ATP-binding protein
LREAAHLSKSPTDLAISLSGGNQQKVLLARWLGKQFDALPVRRTNPWYRRLHQGEIYGLMERLDADGAGLLVVSSEDEEIVRVCHHCLVLHEGSIVEEFDDLTVVTETDLLAAASKVSATV